MNSYGFRVKTTDRAHTHKKSHERHKHHDKDFYCEGNRMEYEDNLYLQWRYFKEYD